MIGAINHLLGIALALAAAPFVAGLLSSVRTVLAGGVATPVLQPYRDLAKLARKEPIVTEHGGLAMRLAPASSCGLLVVAVALTPTVSTELALVGASDLVLVFALLSASRFVEAIAAWDTGSESAVLAASGRLRLSLLAEPAAMTIALAWSALARTTVIPEISAFSADGGMAAGPPVLLGLLVILAIAISDCGRFPISASRPRGSVVSGLSAVAAGFSGRYLALLELASMLRLWIYLSLTIAIFVPWGASGAWRIETDPIVATGIFLLKLFALSLGLAAIGPASARSRADRGVPVLGAALALGVLVSGIVCASLAGRAGG